MRQPRRLILVAIGAVVMALPAATAEVHDAPGSAVIPTAGLLFQDGAAWILQDVPDRAAYGAIVVGQLLPSTSYGLYAGSQLVAKATAAENGLVGFVDVPFSSLATMHLVSEDGTIIPIVDPNSSGAGADVSRADYACDLRAWSGASPDRSVRVFANAYRPYCDLGGYLNIVGTSESRNAVGACQRAGFNGHFSFNDKVMYTWLHHGDPASPPTTGGGDLADCDGKGHGYSYQPTLDCGLGELSLIYYADFSGRTLTAQAGGVWPTVTPCLPRMD